MYIILILISIALAWSKFDTRYDTLKSDHTANVYLNNPILDQLEELQERLLNPTPNFDIFSLIEIDMVGLKLLYK